MSVTLVFFGTWLLSQSVALLTALQLADFFQASEITAVLAATVVFASVAMVVFILAFGFGRTTNAIGWAAISLAVVATLMVLVPGTGRRFLAQSNNLTGVGSEGTFITIELLLPALIAILIQWGLVRRHLKCQNGETDLTLWPWVTLAFVGFAVLNPIGLSILGAAFGSSPTDWMRSFWRILVEAALALVVVMAAIECYIRGRMLHRRRGANGAIRG